MRLFTTSPLGLGIRSGAGDRGHGVQSKFRSQLLKDYNSLNEDKNAWCPILGVYPDAGEVRRPVFVSDKGLVLTEVLIECFESTLIQLKIASILTFLL